MRCISMFISDEDFIRLNAPKISWDKQDCLIRVYCDIGQDYSQFCFKFDYELFDYYYKQCKGDFKLVSGSGYYDKSGDYHMSYMDFSRRVLGEVDDSVIELFSMILRFYRLNPSVCQRAIFKKFKGKGHSRRVELVGKKKEFDKVKFGKSCMGGSRTKSIAPKQKGEQNLQAMQEISSLMNKCIEQSARLHTLQFFGEYKSLFIDLEIASGLRAGHGRFLSKAKEKSLFIKYKSAVESLQR